MARGYKRGSKKNNSYRGSRTVHYAGKLKSGGTGDSYNVRITMERHDTPGQKVSSFLGKLFGKK